MTTKRRAHPEDDMQRQLFQWITLATPRIPQLALAFHVPNGGKRDAREAARLKGLGVRAGVPDVIIPVPHHLGCFCGLALELKSPKGITSDAQSEWLDRLIEYGWRAEVVRSFDEARAMIAGYFGVKP